MGGQRVARRRNIGQRKPALAASIVDRRRNTMCISCGCDEPEANHGNPKHITLQQLKDAAEVAEVDVTQLSKNISEGLKRYGGAK
jgi:hypothetical protein